MNIFRVAGVLSLLSLAVLACSCTEPAAPVADQPGRPNVPQYTMGHWTIVMIDKQEQLTPPQKARMTRMDERFTARVRDIRSQTLRDVLAELEPSQREQYCKKYGEALKNIYWHPNPYFVQFLDKEVDLAGFQKQRITAIIDRGMKEIQEQQTQFNNDVLTVLTPDQRADYTRKQVYSGVWNRIACVHPTKEQQAKFESILDQTIRGADIADQKTRDDLTMRIYFIVRDTVLTEQQLSFFKFYPQAFYPDKPGMAPVRPGQPQPPVQPQSAPVPHKPNAMPPYTPGAAMVNWMDRDFSLTDAQKQQMKTAGEQYGKKTQDMLASMSEDMLALLTAEQKAKLAKPYLKGFPAWVGGMFVVSWLDQQVGGLTAEQKEKAQKVQERYAAKHQDLTAEFNNNLVGVLTPPQREKWTQARLRESVWNRIACVHPSKEQVAKFEAYMKEQSVGVNLGDQKTRDALATKVYVHVRDHILTDEQLKFFKLYPHAFYPDKPEMQKPAPKK